MFDETEENLLHTIEHCSSYYLRVKDGNMLGHFCVCVSVIHVQASIYESLDLETSGSMSRSQEQNKCLCFNFAAKSGIVTGAETHYETELRDLSLQADKFIATTSSHCTDQFDCVVLTMPVPQLLQLHGDIVQLLGIFRDFSTRMQYVMLTIYC